MTSPERDYDDILRRALRAAAESVEPAADGLDRIRGRLSAPRVSPFALFTELLAWLSPLVFRIRSGAAGAGGTLRDLLAKLQMPARLGQAPDWVRPVIDQLAARWRLALAAMGWKAAGERPRAAHRSRPARGGLGARLGPAFTRIAPAASWLRPMLAVAGAVAIVVVAVVALGQAQEFITPTKYSGPGVAHHKATAAATAQGGTATLGVNSPTATPAVGTSAGPRPAATCTTSPAPTSSSAPPVSTPAPTPTQSAIPTPTPTDSATPSPTPTGSAAAAGTGAGQIATTAARRLVLLPCSSASPQAS
jgi:hypothetical protein